MTDRRLHLAGLADLYHVRESASLFRDVDDDFRAIWNAPSQEKRSGRDNC
jgi:hypothetical protein